MELGRVLESHSVLGNQVTIGAYRRESYSGKTWALFRMQQAGTAGGFVSPEFLAQQLGSEVVERLRQAVLEGLAKIAVAEYTGEQLGFGAKPAAAFKMPVQTGAIATSGTPAGGFTVSGEFGRAIITMNRAIAFEEQGPLVLQESVSRVAATILNKLEEAIRQMAFDVVTKRVYQTKAQVVRRGGQSLSEALKKGSKLRYFADQAPSGKLREAVVQGIHALRSFEGVQNAIVIGIDPSYLYGAEREGQTAGTWFDVGIDYSVFVEHGHRVVMPGGREAGTFVLGRPFMKEIIERAKIILNKMVAQLRSHGLGRKLGNTVFAWITDVRSEISIQEKPGFELIVPTTDVYREVPITTPISAAWF